MTGHSTPVTLAPGQRVGPYVLLAPLGSGGSGRVWAAARLGRLGFTKRVALKVLRADKLASERARRRFEAEARLGGQLSHPNLRTVHDLGSFEGRPYMALRWVEASLEELLAHSPGQRLPFEVACWFGIQCCEALAAAHGFVDRAGVPSPIVHRDVSPGNLLLTARGHVLLSDLAAVSEPSGSAAEREAGFFGNLAYAAPEALRQEPVDGRADLFSLGCVLYEALCGAPPFDAEYEHSLVFQVLEQGAPALAERAPYLPAALCQVVERAMARDAAQRFAGALELRQALGACLGGLSAFTLEERAAAVIQAALAQQMCAREEAMAAAFQRFSRQRGEQTDTLPLAELAPASSTSVLLTSSEPGALARTAASLPAPGRSLLRGAWPLAAAVALLASLALLVQRASRAPERVPELAPPILPSPSVEQVRRYGQPAAQPPVVSLPGAPAEPGGAGGGAQAGAGESAVPPAAEPAPRAVQREVARKAEPTPGRAAAKVARSPAKSARTEPLAEAPATAPERPNAEPALLPPDIENPYDELVKLPRVAPPASPAPNPGEALGNRAGAGSGGASLRSDP